MICSNMTDLFLFWHGKYFNVALNFEKISSNIRKGDVPAFKLVFKRGFPEFHLLFLEVPPFSVQKSIYRAV